MVGHLFQNCENTKQETWNLQGEWRDIIKSFETRRLRTCSWRRKGDNSREREKRRNIDLFKQTLKVMFHIITSSVMSRVLPVGR